MDFKKIEWIFFVAFLGLNVFLFSSYHDAVYQENNVIRSNQTESIQQRLASDDITYTGKISSENKQGYYLSAEQTNLSTSLANYRKAGKSGLLASGVFLDGDVLTKSLSSSDAEKNVIDPDKISSSLEDFLSNKDNILFGNDYVYTKNFSHLEEEPLESQEYEGIPFNDDTAKIVLSLEKNDNDYSITKYMQTHLSDIEQLREKTELYTEEEAINTLYINNKIPRGSKILWRQLAYSCILKVREKNVYVPVWHVAIETSDKVVQIESVNAFSNTIVTNNTVPKVEDQ